MNEFKINDKDQSFVTTVNNMDIVIIFVALNWSLVILVLLLLML